MSWLSKCIFKRKKQELSLDYIDRLTNPQIHTCYKCNTVFVDWNFKSYNFDCKMLDSSIITTLCPKCLDKLKNTVLYTINH